MNHSVSEEELILREYLRIELIEKMKVCEVTNSELAEILGKSVGLIVAYRRGNKVLTQLVQDRLLTAIKEIVDHRNKPRGPIIIPDEEIQRRIDRRSILNEEMKKNDISDKELATHAKMSKSMIEKFREGTYSITKSKWEILTTALESIRLKGNDQMNAYTNNPVIVEKRCNHSTKHVEAYIFRNILETGNALIIKKKFKGHEEQVLKDLRDFGFECEAHILPDGDYVLERINRNA